MKMHNLDSRNRITVTGANIVFLIFTLLWILWQTIIIILSDIYGYDFATRYTYGVLVVNEYIIILIPVLIYFLIKKVNPLKFMRFNKLQIKSAAMIILMALPAYGIAVMLNAIAVYFLQNAIQLSTFQLPVPHTLLEYFTGILVLAVTPAICEEILHRGLLLRAYENRGSLKAVVITAILFGIFHFDISNLLGTTFLGLLMGYYVMKTNSIFAGMLGHFISNTIAETLIYIGRDIPMERSTKILPSQLFAILVLGLICIFVLSILLKVFKQVTTNMYIFKPSISKVRIDIASIISHWPIAIILVLFILTQALQF